MSSIDEVRSVRLSKIEKLKEAGMTSYPVSSGEFTKISSLISDFDGLVLEAKNVNAVGRIMSLRPQGGLVFANIFDGFGSIQILLKKSTETEKTQIEDLKFDLFIDTIDIGDFVRVTGIPFVTKRGEKTINVSDWKILSKSLRNLPEKFHGLTDIEERFRRRYLDTLTDEVSRNRFVVRSKIVTEMRRFLDDDGFLEVETPILQSLAGGATAEPFLTHHNALDVPMFLRIAPELFLKELLVGGFPKVYEIGRLFRNEGIDTTHNPEFTTLEFYEAFGDASKHRTFIEKFIQTIVKNIFGKTSVTYDGTEIDFADNFTVTTYGDLLSSCTGIKNIFELDRDQVAREAVAKGIYVAPSDTWEKIIDNLYKKLCRDTLIQPTYIIDYPKAFSPLAKNHESNPKLIDRFQLVIAGFELVNAFSELNDPVEQTKRFADQQKNKEMGDKEAQPNDLEYVEAMEYGMPPAGGVGMSVDRLAMILTDTKNIREVILFPTLKPRAKP